MSKKKSKRPGAFNPPRGPRGDSVTSKSSTAAPDANVNPSQGIVRRRPIHRDFGGDEYVGVGAVYNIVGSQGGRQMIGFVMMRINDNFRNDGDFVVLPVSKGTYAYTDGSVLRSLRPLAFFAHDTLVWYMGCKPPPETSWKEELRQYSLPGSVVFSRLLAHKIRIHRIGQRLSPAESSEEQTGVWCRVFGHEIFHAKSDEQAWENESKEPDERLQKSNQDGRPDAQQRAEERDRIVTSYQHWSPSHSDSESRQRRRSRSLERRAVGWKPRTRDDPQQDPAKPPTSGQAESTRQKEQHPKPITEKPADTTKEKSRLASKREVVPPSLPLESSGTIRTQTQDPRLVGKQKQQSTSKRQDTPTNETGQKVQTADTAERANNSELQKNGNSKQPSLRDHAEGTTLKAKLTGTSTSDPPKIPVPSTDRQTTATEQDQIMAEPQPDAVPPADPTSTQSQPEEEESWSQQMGSIRDSEAALIRSITEALMPRRRTEPIAQEDTSHNPAVEAPPTTDAQLEAEDESFVSDLESGEVMEGVEIHAPQPSIKTEPTPDHSTSSGAPAHVPLAAHLPIRDSSTDAPRPLKRPRVSTLSPIVAAPTTTMAAPAAPTITTASASPAPAPPPAPPRFLTAQTTSWLSLINHMLSTSTRVPPASQHALAWNSLETLLGVHEPRVARTRNQLIVGLSARLEDVEARRGEYVGAGAEGGGGEGGGDDDEAEQEREREMEEMGRLEEELHRTLLLLMGSRDARFAVK